MTSVQLESFQNPFHERKYKSNVLIFSLVSVQFCTFLNKWTQIHKKHFFYKNQLLAEFVHYIQIKPSESSARLHQNLERRNHKKTAVFLVSVSQHCFCGRPFCLRSWKNHFQNILFETGWKKLCLKLCGKRIQTVSELPSKIVACCCQTEIHNLKIFQILDALIYT